MQIKDPIVDKFVAAYGIEVPQDLVDEELAIMIYERKHKMAYESLATRRSAFFAQNEIDNQIQTIKEEAFKSVKTRLLLEKIIETERFEITQDELEDEAKAISERQQMPIEMVKDFLGEDLLSLKNDLIARKALAFIHSSNEKMFAAD